MISVLGLSDYRGVFILFRKARDLQMATREFKKSANRHKKEDKNGERSIYIARVYPRCY